MKLKFKQQQYQTDAINAVVNCFLGQKKDNRRDLLARYIKTINEETLFEKKEQVEVISFGNHPITLTESERRKNIREVQRKNDINYTDNAGLNDFTIERETGTGKTYTYINAPAPALSTAKEPRKKALRKCFHLHRAFSHVRSYH